MLFVFSNIFFSVSHNHKTLLGLFYTNASKLKGMVSSTEDTVSCSSVDGCFRWPAECRGEAEHLLGSCCKGPSSPWRNQPSLCSCTTLWIMCKPLQAVNLSHKPLRTTGQNGSSWQQAGSKQPRGCISPSSPPGLQLHLEGKGSQKTESKGIGKRCWRALVKGGAGFWREPWLNFAPRSSQDPKQPLFWLNSGCQHQVLHYHGLLECFSSVLFLLKSLKLPGHLLLTQDKV